MASILSVEQLQGLAAGSTPNTITVPTGQKIVGTDEGSIYAPGMAIQMAESGTFGDTQQTSSGTWLDTEMFVDIAPKFTNSKIVVMGSPVILLVGTGSLMRGSIRVIRTIGGLPTSDSSAVNVFNTGDFIEQFQVRNASNEHNTIGSIVLTDTPNTTSYARYRVQVYYYGDSGSTQFRLWGSARGSKLIAQEIAQ